MVDHQSKVNSQLDAEVDFGDFENDQSDINDQRNDQGADDQFNQREGINKSLDDMVKEEQRGRNG